MLSLTGTYLFDVGLWVAGAVTSNTFLAEHILKTWQKQVQLKWTLQASYIKLWSYLHLLLLSMSPHVFIIIIIINSMMSPTILLCVKYLILNHASTWMCVQYYFRDQFSLMAIFYKFESLDSRVP